MKKVFIDGKAGTTGLRIYERLEKRDDILLVSLSESLRKSVSARKDALNDADVAILCLPDDAAREAVSLIENKNTVVIDASTAHRTHADWVYGFPELSLAHREKIANSKRIYRAYLSAYKERDFACGYESDLSCSERIFRRGEKGDRGLRIKGKRLRARHPAVVCARTRS